MARAMVSTMPPNCSRSSVVDGQDGGKRALTLAPSRRPIRFDTMSSRAWVWHADSSGSGRHLIKETAGKSDG
jgi:hypothetical protein